ncbi:glycosyltransferase family A protein, partial [Echinicola sediminis]
VICQTYTNWELIIIDDGSTDNTREVVGDFLIDKRIKYIYQENAGVSAARNHGVKNSIGKYLCFLDSDDWVKESWLEDFMWSLKQETDELVILSGYVKRLSKGLSIINLPDEKSYIPKLSGTFLVSRKIFDCVGGYDVNLKFGENTELFFRIDRISKLKHIIIYKANLIYNQSNDGGSRSLDGTIESLKFILNKHGSHLGKHVCFLYYQILGVNLLKKGQIKDARYYLKRGVICKPWNLKAYGRLLISILP